MNRLREEWLHVDPALQIRLPSSAMELITVGENQYIFKYKRAEACRSSRFMTATSTSGYSQQDIYAYILVGAFRGETLFCYRGIGTFQAPNWTELNSQVVGAPRTSLLEEVFFIILEY
jgi:hypothetical protein